MKSRLMTTKSASIIFIWMSLFFMSMIMSTSAYAKSKGEIDASVTAAFSRFESEIPAAKSLLDSAKAVLVMPGVIKGGFWFGGQYGEGAVFVQGEKFDYYNMMSASFGFQFGAQKKDIFLLFMDDSAFRQFRAGEGWEVGVDGSVVIIDVGTEGSIDTTKTNQAVIGFVMGQKGLMIDVSLEGTKFNRISPE
jgi:lipid-binding SYLF domain-containing protein